jgi:Tol biopolymer transport system component
MNCQFGRNYEVFVAEVEGRTFEPSDEIRLTTHLASDAGPAWSPDGEHIVFASNRAYVQTDDPRRSDLYRVHANGSGLQRIAKNIRIGESLWSPDGKHIAIEETKESIRLLNVGNGQVDTLGVELPSNVRFHHVVDWAANGSMLLLASDDDQDRLIAMNPEGGQTQNVPFPTDMRLQGVDWFVEPNN